MCGGWDSNEQVVTKLIEINCNMKNSTYKFKKKKMCTSMSMSFKYSTNLKALLTTLASQSNNPPFVLS
jgi:hypothetical protein